MNRPVSNLDLAAEFLSQGREAKTFADIWNYVCEKQAFSQEEKDSIIARFYTNLTLDGRFIQLDKNLWNLRSNCKYEEIKESTANVYNEDDDAELTEDDDEDETISATTTESDEDSEEQDESK